jgi:general secretion pathway protein J
MRGARNGFTLLEVILALTLTAVSVSIAGSALRTATIARDRIAEHRTTMEREARMRSMVSDMLRHAPRAEAVDEPLLRIVPTAGGGTQLVFLSQGVRAPFGTGAIWRVSVHVADSGLQVDAETIGAAREGTRLQSVVPGIRSFSVQVLEPQRGADRAQWRTDWPLAQMRPAMIALTFGDADAPPLLVSLDPIALTAMVNQP